MADSVICQPPPEHAALLWPAVEPHIRRALVTTQGCYEPIDILQGILAGQMQLWISWHDGVEAAMVTELVSYPRRRACRVFLVGGTGMRRWLQSFQTTVEAFARAHGCDFMEGGARFGWTRAAGYRVVGCALAKEL